MYTQHKHVVASALLGVLGVNQAALGQPGGAPPEPAPPTFEPAVLFETRSQPVGIDAADITGDNYPEVAVAHQFSFRVSVFENSGDWSVPANGLINRKDYHVTPNARDLVFADMDGDLDLDLVVNSTSVIFILRNDGTGQYGTEADPDVMAVIPLLIKHGWGIGVADFDANGLNDVAVAGYDIVDDRHDPRAEILWGRTQPANFEQIVETVPGIQFAEGTAVATGAFQYPQIAGRLDVAMTMIGFTDTLFVLRNEGTDGNGNTIWTKLLQTGTNGWGIAADRLKDKQTDLVTTEIENDSEARVFLGQPDAAFQLHFREYELHAPLGNDPAPWRSAG